MNALGHLSKLDSKKISLYTTIFPCHSCAKNLLSYDLEKVVFKRFYSAKKMPSTIDLFKEAKTDVYQLDLSIKRDIDIRYNESLTFFLLQQIFVCSAS